MHSSMTGEEMAILIENSNYKTDDSLMLNMNDRLEEIIQTTETLMSAVQDITDIVNGKA
ncbi:MAG: hypothetical protein IIB94_00950 [Candidatus Marinimicrobia bacterium]|nr:hypothetical protein [Candidatus Neomarinimicrobiota bacterium]